MPRRFERSARVVLVQGQGGVMAGGEARPVELNLSRHKDLRIKWSDGSESVIDLVALRKACPCATCRAEREDRAKNPLAVRSADVREEDMVVVEDAEVVGHYGLKVRWKDGHDTGIYDFALLRELG